MSISDSLKHLEQTIGFPPFMGAEYGKEAIEEYQRAVVISWLVIKGIDRNGLNKSSLTTLGKLYKIEKYFNTVLLNQERDGKKKPFKKYTPYNPPIVDWGDDPETNTTPVETETKIMSSTPVGFIEKHTPYTPADFIDKRQLNLIIRNIVEANLFIENKKLQDQIIEVVHQILIKEVDKNIDLATQAGHDAAKYAIENLAPRRLIISRPNLPDRELSPQPRHHIFEQCLDYISMGEHIYVVGPAGTGKTHIGQQIAEALDKKFLPMPQALTKYELSGYLDGSGIYRGTVFREAVEFGGHLVMDEIDINGASAIAFANSVMANGYCAFPDGMIKAHKDLTIMACANTYGFGATQKYIGRNPLDAASLDRFRYINCDYDPQMERMIFGQSEFLSYIHKVRQAITTLNLDHIVSMRAIQRGLNDLTLNKDPSYVMQQIWRNLNPDTINKIRHLAGEYRGETINLRSVA